MSETKPVLLASDVHLGATHPGQERAFGEWLDYAADAASWIVLNGDLFDFWFEHRWGVPHRYDAVLTQLTEITSSGVPVTLMGGNHDWWGGRYLRDEVGLEFLQEPIVRNIAGYKTFLAHGDGLGAGDIGYHALKLVLRSRPFRFAFGLLPTSLGYRIGGHVSNTEERWDQWGERQEERSAALEAWAGAKLDAEPELDLVVLGHTHLPMVVEHTQRRWYVNTGDWVHHKSFVTLEPGRPPHLAEWGAAER